MNFKEFVRLFKNEPVETLREIERHGFEAPFDIPNALREEFSGNSNALKVFAGSLADKKERGEVVA